MGPFSIFFFIFCSAIQCSWQISPRVDDDFLIISRMAGISYFQLATETGYQMSVRNLTSAHSIEYDAKHNCVFWTDSKRVVRQCLGRYSPAEVLISNGVDNIVDLAYDWESETLYFVDAGRHRIEAVETSDRVRRPITGQNNWRCTIVEFGPHTTSTALAVDPGQGYLVWAQYGLGVTQNASIYRANLDGSEAQQLQQHPDVMKPVEIAIDHENHQVYWIDYSGNFIATCTATGDSYRIFVRLNSERKHSNVALAARNGLVYWSDYEGKIHASEEDGVDARDELLPNGTVEVENTIVAYDFKVYNKRSQSNFNDCGTGTHNCSHICVTSASGPYKCLCPDALHTIGFDQCTCPYGAEEECYKRLYGCQMTELECVSDSKCISL